MKYLNKLRWNLYLWIQAKACERYAQAVLKEARHKVDLYGSRKQVREADCSRVDSGE